MYVYIYVFNNNQWRPSISECVRNPEAAREREGKWKSILI